MASSMIASGSVPCPERMDARIGAADEAHAAAMQLTDLCQPLLDGDAAALGRCRHRRRQRPGHLAQVVA